MFIIPGFLFSFLTFPGVIMHELGHQLACWLSKVYVFQVQYFKFDLHTVGFVEHERTNNPGKSLLITYGPFLLNTLVGTICVFPMAIMWVVSDERILFSSWMKVLVFVLAYIGFSCLANAFPSTKDAESLFTSVVKNKEVPLIAKIIVTPFIVVIYICSILKFIWFDFIFAFSVPEIIYALISHNSFHFMSWF